MPFGIVACTFPDSLSRNSCIHKPLCSEDMCFPQKQLVSKLVLHGLSLLTQIKLNKNPAYGGTSQVNTFKINYEVNNTEITRQLFWTSLIFPPSFSPLISHPSLDCVIFNNYRLWANNSTHVPTIKKLTMVIFENKKP